jgi:Putative peptidoglycan binding domain
MDQNNRTAQPAPHADPTSQVVRPSRPGHDGDDGQRTHGRRRRRIAGLLLAVLAAAGALVVTATPAAASTPRCSTSYLWHKYDYNGDASLAAAYSPWIKPWTPFHYWITTPVALYGDGSPRWSCWMGVGATGEPVKALQRSLNACYSTYSINWVGGHNLGFAQLSVDGIYGSKTKAALAAVQRYLGITVDGVYGSETATHMKFKGETDNDGLSISNYCHTLNG